MFRKRKRIADSIRCELCGIVPLLGRVIPAMILGAALILVSWIYFGGPCRVTLFFRIPGGGFTITAYYILWFVMFAIAGGECVLIHRFAGKWDGNRTILYHIAAHLCLLLWYPLFFTTFSQFLALLIIAAATVLLILVIKEAACFSFLLAFTGIIKLTVSAVFVYINLAFLILN